MAFVAPHGELDLGTAPALGQALEEVAGHATLVLDLRGLSFIDSTGVDLVLGNCERADARGRELHIITAPVEVQRVFEVAGVRERVGPYLDHPDATPKPLGRRASVARMGGLC